MTRAIIINDVRTACLLVGVTDGRLVRTVILACMKPSTRCNYRLNLLLSYGSHSVTKISVTPFRLDRHPIGPST